MDEYLAKFHISVIFNSASINVDVLIACWETDLNFFGVYMGVI